MTIFGRPVMHAGWYDLKYEFMQITDRCRNSGFCNDLLNNYKVLLVFVNKSQCLLLI